MTDLTPNDLSHLSDAEFHALCPQGEHAPGPEPLSPAALAEPVAEPPAVTERPSDDELLALMPQQFRNDLATVSRLAAHGAGPVMPGMFRVTLNTGALDFARAVLARWGQPPAPPAEGEAAELVKYLRGIKSLHCQRAAELLERHTAPVPVPVAERLPGPEDCDREGFIWLWDSDRRWVRQHREAASSNTWVGSLWLPGHALPLPAPQGGEVEP